MTGNEFELLVQRYLKKRLKQIFNNNIQVDHQRKFESEKGNKYKIDLSYSYPLYGTQFLTLVECKYWKSSVSREKVGYLRAILDDLKINRGIMVTTKSFQRGAITYAQSQNIGLIKITNDTHLDDYSYFDGGLQILDFMLNKGIPLDPTKPYTSVGLFTSNYCIYDYIKTYHGTELGTVLENPESFKGDDKAQREIIKEQLINTPDNWYENYVLNETAGLRYKLKNEPEMRLINLIMYTLKFEEQNRS